MLLSNLEDNYNFNPDPIINLTVNRINQQYILVGAVVQSLDFSNHIVYIFKHGDGPYIYVDSIKYTNNMSTMRILNNLNGLRGELYLYIKA